MPASRRPALTLSALVAGAAIALSACGNGAAEDTGAAEPGTPGASPASDGSVVLYSGRNENLVQPIIDRFTDETGIAVEVRYANTAEMAAQLLEEGSTSPADVFLAQDAGALGAVAREGIVDELPSEVLDLVPEAYRDADGQWVGVTGRVRVLAYNPDLVEESELPQSIDELVEPQWQGRVGVAPTNASFQSFVTAMRVSRGDEATEQWLTALRDNDPQIRERNGQILADVDAGTIDTGLINHYYVGELAQEQGVDVDGLTARLHYFPDGDLGGLVNISGVALTQDQPDEDGLEFVRFMLSESTQQAFVEETYEYPLVEGVEGPAQVPPLSDLEQPEIDLNDLDSLDETVQMVTRVGLS